MATPFARIREALDELRAGRMALVVDAAGPGAGGDLVLAAPAASPAAIVAMTRLAGGPVRLALGAERYEALGISGPIEAREGDDRGARGQARAVAVAIDPGRGRDDLVPGGLLPVVRAGRQGLLSRPAPAEAAVDAARLAGLGPAALTATVHEPDGAAAGLAALTRLAAAESLPLVSVDELLAYRRHNESLVERVVETALPTRYGDFVAVGYRVLVGDDHQLALTVGDLAGAEDVTVRVHPKCVTGDVFHSLMCRCGDRLDRSLALIAEEGRGALIYSLSDDDGVCAQVLADLGVASVRLLAERDERVPRLGDFGIAVSGQVPLGVEIGRRPRSLAGAGHG